MLSQLKAVTTWRKLRVPRDIWWSPNCSLTTPLKVGSIEVMEWFWKPDWPNPEIPWVDISPSFTEVTINQNTASNPSDTPILLCKNNIKSNHKTITHRELVSRLHLHIPASLWWLCPALTSTEGAHDLGNTPDPGQQYSETPLPWPQFHFKFYFHVIQGWFGVQECDILKPLILLITHLIIWHNTFQSGLVWIWGEQHPTPEIIIIKNRGSRKVRFCSFKPIKFIKKDFFIPTGTPYRELQKLGMDLSAGS